MTRSAADIVRESHEVATATQGPSFDLLADDVEWMNAEFALENEKFVGHEGVQRWVDNLKDAFDYVWFEVEEAHEQGDGVVLTLSHIRGTARESGLSTDLALWTLWRVRAAKIDRARGFESREAAEAAVEGFGSL